MGDGSVNETRGAAMRISRRALVVGSLAAGAATLLAACTPAAPPASKPADSGTAAKPAATTAPAAAAATSAPSQAAPAQTSAPAAAAAAGTPKKGGEYILASLSDANSLEPHNDLTNVRIYVTGLVYDNLVSIDQDLKLQPGLAESWTVAPDNLTYTFKLRKGAKFHNGREVTADDVIWTYNRILDPKLNASQKVDLETIDTMTAPDPYTLVIKTKIVFGEFLTALAGYSTMIVPKEVVEQNGDLRKVAVGSGPFIFEEWREKTHIKLRKNPDHWEANNIHVDRITIPIIPDEQTALAQLRSGAVHSLLLSDLKNVGLVKDDKALALQKSSTLQTDILVFNCGKPPFDDLKLRQAFSWAIDRNKVLAGGAAGLGELTGPLPPAMKPYALPGASFPSHTPDKEKAKAMLKELGKENMTTTILVSATNPNARGMLNAQVMADELRQVGVTMNVQMLEPAVWSKRFPKPTYDFELSSNSIIGYLGPDAYLYFRFNHEGFNQPNWNETDIEKTLLEGRQTPDGDKRTQIYQDVQKTLVDRVPYLWLYTLDNYWVHQPFVKGFRADPAGRWIAAKSVWLDK
jgi:peptide/nickel transport system substrate-binding protein